MPCLFLLLNHRIQSCVTVNQLYKLRTAKNDDHIFGILITSLEEVRWCMIAQIESHAADML